MLTLGAPISDVSHWLGHRNIQTTYGIYGHMVDSSMDRGRELMEKHQLRMQETAPGQEQTNASGIPD